MNIESAEKLFDDNEKQILRIFKKIQMLEFWLKTKIADKKSRSAEDFEIYEKWLEDKTWNFVIDEFLVLYPEKENLRFELKRAMAGRNKFMHAVYTWAMVSSKTRVEEEGKAMLDDIEEDIARVLKALLAD
ncbi:MAG: hypothetical protein M1586_01835 [Patescibacteria group bacterium]|nr:hypothetical protein [Patescibacteria group bacterium]MCL5262023.1 hypothetical protein [Patescibacteria group bacterium]